MKSYDEIKKMKIRALKKYAKEEQLDINISDYSSKNYSDLQNIIITLIISVIITNLDQKLTLLSPEDFENKYNLKNRFPFRKYIATKNLIHINKNWTDMNMETFKKHMVIHIMYNYFV